MEIFKLFGTIMVDNSKANNQIEDTSKKADKASDGLADLAQEAGLLGSAVANAASVFFDAIGVKAVMAADDLQKSLNKLQAQTGASSEDMKKFEDSIMTLYRANVGQSFDDIATGMSEIARTTGLTGKDLETTTKNAIALRDTFEFSVNESARTANSLMKQFGISSKDAYEIMAQSAQQGANKNGDLLDTLNEYSPMFKAAGYTAAEFGNILIQGAKDGSFSIDMVGDAVKESNIRLKDGSKTSREAVAGLGLVYDQIAGDFAKGGELAASAYNTVVTNLSKIEDPLKKNDLAVKLFGTQFENLETTILGTLTNAGDYIDTTKGSLDKINDVKYDTFGEALGGLGRQLNADFFIPLGKKLIPKLEELMKVIKDNEPTIRNALGKAVEVVSGLFDALATAIKFVIDNFNIFKPIIVAVTGAIAAQFIIDTVRRMYTAWTTATKAQTAAQVILNAVTKASPFGLIALLIGAVIAVGLLLYENWDSVAKFGKTVWGGLKTFFVATFNFLSSFFSTVWNGIKTVASTVFNAIKTTITTIFESVKTAITNVWNTVKTTLSTVWNGIKTTATTVFNGIKTAISTVFNSMKTSILAVWNTIKTSLSNVWTNLKETASSKFNGVVDFFKKAVDKVKGFFKGLGTSIKNVFTSIVSSVKTPIQTVIGVLNGFIGGAEKIINKVVGAINKIPNINLPKKLGGWSLGIPEMKLVEFGRIPGLAEGGTVTETGTVMVGEQGPEFLNLPRGASVVPLDKSGSVNITINNPHIFNERDAEKLGNLLVRHMKMKGINPRGV